MGKKENKGQCNAIISAESYPLPVRVAAPCTATCPKECLLAQAMTSTRINPSTISFMKGSCKFPPKQFVIVKIPK